VNEQNAVAGYFRVSRARDDMKAPELYRTAIESYCTYKGLELEEVFSDIDISGRRGGLPRPGLDAPVTARKRFAAVIVPKLSRFGRSMTHLVQLFDTFEDDGIALVFLDLGIDTSTSQGRLLSNVMAAFAEYESDVPSDYSRASHDRRARLGLPDGGWAPMDIADATTPTFVWRAWDSNPQELALNGFQVMSTPSWLFLSEPDRTHLCRRDNPAVDSPFLGECPVTGRR
jgi:DNA invertase Pin-like site-specific DNA recombinase